MRDQATKIKVDMTVASGDEVDVQGAEALSITLESAAGTTITLLEGDDSAGSGATAVEAHNIIVADDDGVKAANVVTYSDSGTALVGYVGKKRYLTVTIGTPATNTAIGAIWGELRYSPEAS